MTMQKAALLLGVVLLGLSRPGLSLTATEQVVAANNDFAMDLYGQIRSNSVGENMFFSPFSVSSALAMVYAGAKGNTKTEMGNVLKVDSVNPKKVHAGFGQLFKAFNDPTNNYTLSVANAFFGRKGRPVLKRYLTLVSRKYHALLKRMNFKKKPERSRKYINKWVAANTNQKIKDLLPQGSVPKCTAAVLVNTIYFDGLWVTPFQVTLPSIFDLTPAKSTRIKMMNLSVKRLNYADVNSLSCKILELPYAGDEVSMYILLPNSINGLAALESQLTSAKLNNAISRMHSTKVVDVAIPKFKMTLQVDLNDILKSMGMKDLFVRGRADLSGMDGTRKLFVSKVIHRAYIDVTEEGTEAGAAAGAVISSRNAHPFGSKTFRADHPFLFFIREKVTGSILFSGRFLKPLKAEDGSSPPKAEGGSSPLKAEDGSSPPKAEGGSSGTGRKSMPSSGTIRKKKPSRCDEMPKWLCDLVRWLGIQLSRRGHD